MHGHDTGNRDKHMVIHTTDWEAKAYDAKRRTWDQNRETRQTRGHSWGGRDTKGPKRELTHWSDQINVFTNINLALFEQIRFFFQ